MCVRQCVWTLCISITKCGHIESMSYCLHPRFLHERPVTLSKGSWPRISSRWVALWAVWWVIWPSFRSGRCHGWRMVKEKDRKEAKPFRPKNNLGLENQNELSELMFFGCMKTYFMNESSFLSRHWWVSKNAWSLTDGRLTADVLERSESHGGFPEFTLTIYSVYVHKCTYQRQ